MSGEPPRGRELAIRLMGVRNLAIDRLAATIAREFEGHGIEALVLKGPVLAEWLYADEVRPYGDADLLVSPDRWDAAVELLKRLGFRDYLGPMAHPRMESFASTAFLRGEDNEENLDLHCTLHGLEAPRQEVWSAFRAGAEKQTIGGAELRIPGRAALLLHIGLHAAHHAEGKALTDLQRALAAADERLWQEALGLARRLQGVPTFASGLRLVPEGAALAERLGIGEARSPRHDIRFERVPTAEGIDELLRPGLSLRERLAMVAGELFPPPSFMRWWSPLAVRGKLGLALSYPWRWIWLLGHAPRGWRAVRRVRRRSAG